MSIHRVVVIVVAGLLTACTEKSKPQPSTKTEVEKTEAESDLQPREDEIAEDCVAFVRTTKVIPAQSPTPGCVNCAAVAEATEALGFQQFQADKVSCSGDTCEAAVTIRATFNPAPAGAISGGLTAWLSPEQQTGYLQGNPPTGQQTFSVKVIYRRTSRGWRPVEFDRADSR
jgi:hypothetical protein